MMFAGFLFLLLLTGGSTNNHTEFPDGEGFYNQSDLDRGSSNNQTVFPDGEGSYNRSDLDRGKTDNNTEPFDYHRDYWERRLNETHCTATDLIHQFNLTDKAKFYMSRPNKNHKIPINVTLDVYLYSILDVKEKEQELISYFWIIMVWRNEFIEWEQKDLCFLYEIVFPSELLWKPDLTIEEITQKDKLFQTQYLTVTSSGLTIQRNGVVLVSTCKMEFYRFPFDTQTCKLTFKSIQHDYDHMRLLSGVRSEDIYDFTRWYMKNESEWLLLNVTVETRDISNFGFYSSVLVYTLTLKRRSVLYVANFVVPILFFLCLDLASFLISESGGEKLSFKVTVLLAVTVMQLILNDILPSSSDRIPLIAVYCIGSFALMMLSLLETIFIMYLMEKEDVTKDKEADKDQSLCDTFRDQRAKVQNCFRDINKSISCVRIFGDPPAETPPELLPKVKEGSSSQLTEEIHDSENLTEELIEVLKTVALLLNSRKEEKEPGYWTRMTKKLNRIYFVFYLITASVFLITVFSIWLSEHSNNIDTGPKRRGYFW